MIKLFIWVLMLTCYINPGNIIDCFCINENPEDKALYLERKSKSEYQRGYEKGFELGKRFRKCPFETCVFEFDTLYKGPCYGKLSAFYECYIDGLVIGLNHGYSCFR